MFIDSHAHLFFEDFKDEVDAVISRALNSGVESIVVPGTGLETSREAIALAERYDCIYACVGFHPHEASKADQSALEKIEELSRHPKVVAIGEIGLDFHYDFSPRETQRTVFQRQIELAVRRDLPIVVHTRESVPETIAIVEEAVRAHPEWRRRLTNSHSRVPSPKGVFHCFTGDADQGWHLLSLGFSVSYPGIVTFRNSPVVETLRRLGYDHILLETDSPFLAPVPHRGKRNEPANVALIGAKVAEILGASIDDVARTATFNTKRLFGFGKKESPRITYKLRNSLYLNLTIRCNADCVFCDRKGEAVVKGYNLKIEKEPEVEEVIQEIGDPTAYDEIVFCGYGEPTIRLEELKKISSWIKSKGGKVRLNTDGHGNIIHKRNIVPELKGLVDKVSISLNSVDPKQYGELMRVDGERFHKAMVEFAQECVRSLPETMMTAVDLPDVDKQQAQEFVEKTIGAKFVTRPYF
ncbi:MAG: TatD family hydrolase [Bacteroidota bacterium]